MLQTSTILLFGVLLGSISLVCIHYQRINKKQENAPAEFFWSGPHLKSLFHKDIRNRILFTILIVILFRLGTMVTIPNVDTVGLVKALNDNPLISMMNLLGAGGLEQFSIFSLGVGPYITASIIIQLLSMDVVPRLTELSKQGHIGRLKLNQYTKVFGVLFAIVQSISLVYGFSQMYPNLFPDGFSWVTTIQISLIFTAGTSILVWLGDQITKKGIGNGLSVLIATGILARFPEQFQSAYTSLVSGEITPDNGVQLFIGILVVFIIIAIFIGLLNTTEYRVPIQYTSGNANLRNGSNYLPLKFNSANVIPVIFASSIMMVPLQLMTFFAKENTELLTTLQDWLGLGSWKSLVIYGVLIVFFCYFYTQLQINPEQLSENLAKSGAYIPEIRPGKDTQTYISKLLNKLTTLGALALLTVSLLPYILPLAFPELPTSLPIGGTGMIIVVGVVIEIYRQIKGLIIQTSYARG